MEKRIKIALRNGKMTVETNYKGAELEHKKILNSNLYRMALEHLGLREFETFVPECGSAIYMIKSGIDRACREEGRNEFFAYMGG